MRLDGFGLFVEDMAKMIRFIEMFLALRLKKAKTHQMFILLRMEHCFCYMEEKILKT